MLNPIVADYFREYYKVYLIYFLLLLLIIPLETIVLTYYLSRLTTPGANIRRGRVIALVVIIVSAVATCYYFKQCVDTHLIPSFLSFSRQRLFTNALMYYETRPFTMPVSSFMNHIIHSTSVHQGIMYNAINASIPALISVLIVVGFLFYIDIRTALLCVCGVLAIGLVIVYMGQASVSTSSAKEASFTEMSARLHERFENLENIYLNDTMQEEAKNISDDIHAYRDRYRESLVQPSNMYLTIIVVLVTCFGLGATLLFQKYREKRIGEVLFFTALVLLVYLLTGILRVTSTLPEFVDQVGMYKYSEAYIRELMEDPTQAPATTDASVVTDDALHGDIVFEHVTFAYETGRPVLKDFSTRFPYRKTTAIFGRSGMGKTTLFRLLLRFYDPEDGTITVNGHDTRTISPAVLRRRIMYMNQSTMLFDKTVLDNILYGNPEGTEARAREVLEKYGLDEIYAKLPQGILTMAGKQGRSLSLGMQKITLLMRGIMRTGRLLYVLDEPLSGLDAETREKVLRMIATELHGRTVVIITHDDEILEICDHVVRL